MRLSPWPIVARSAALLLLVTAPMEARPVAASAPAPQERDWVVLPLPTEDDDTVARGPAALLDGRHVFLTGEPATNDATLGPLLAPRAAEEIVWRAVQGVPGGDGSVEPLGDSILVRGSLEARQAGATALASLRDELDALHFDLHATLVATAAGENRREVVFDETRRARTGAVVAFGRRHETSFVTDFDVEVANEMAIADPVVGRVLSGETVHLWTSSFLAADGRRRVFVQGLLDISAIESTRSFEPDLFELGTIDQPVVTSSQVLFTGVVPESGALTVELDGLWGDLPGRTLEIGVAPRDAVGAAASVVDLGRGLWRERIGGTHVLLDRKKALTPAVGPTPNSLAQLYFNTFRRDGTERPVLGEALMIVDSNAPDLARDLRVLAGELDPLGEPARCTVTWGEFTARVPAIEGGRVRVTRTRETSYVVDYDPQVASMAALSDPLSLRFTSGLLIDGVVRDGVLMGHGVLESVDVERVRDATPSDVGRIQLPVRTRVPFPLRLQRGERARPIADLGVEWMSGSTNELPR